MCADDPGEFRLDDYPCHQAEAKRGEVAHFLVGLLFPSPQIGVPPHSPYAYGTLRAFARHTTIDRASRTLLAKWMWTMRTGHFYPAPTPSFTLQHPVSRDRSRSRPTRCCSDAKVCK